MPKSLALKIKESNFSDQAYMLHIQIHNDYMCNVNSDGFVCHMCSKYTLPKAMKTSSDSEYQDA